MPIGRRGRMVTEAAVRRKSGTQRPLIYNPECGPLKHRHILDFGLFPDAFPQL